MGREDDHVANSQKPDLVGSPDILLVLPPNQATLDPVPIPGYSIQPLAPELDCQWIDIHRHAVPSFSEANLKIWLTRYRQIALRDGILVAVDDVTGRPVATAGSIAHSKDGMFPNGGQLAWVATMPEHQGQGLATWLSALATKRLVDEGFQSIFVCTGDDMPWAIYVYLKLGYVPYLYASDQPDRWAKICDLLDHPFEPEEWGRN